MDNCANMDVAVNRRLDAIDRPEAINTLEYRWNNRTDASIELTSMTICVFVKPALDGSWGTETDVKRRRFEGIDPSCTVGTFKDTVATVFGLFENPAFRSARLRLKYKGKELKNAKTLSSYGIEEDAVIVGESLGVDHPLRSQDASETDAHDLSQVVGGSNPLALSAVARSVANAAEDSTTRQSSGGSSRWSEEELAVLTQCCKYFWL